MTKTLRLFVFLVFMLSCVAAFGQGQRYDGFSWQRVGNYVAVAPHSKVTWCGYPSSATPGAPCTNVVNTYTDDTLTTQCPAGQQVVLAGTNTCVSSSDLQGNFGVWVTTGLYSYTITYGGITYGPYYASVGGSGVPATRHVNTTFPLQGGGPLSGDLTLLINPFVGDSGAGGAAGSVPAPAAGDFAANKYLDAGGGWSVPPTGVPTTRTIGTAAPLTGGGDLSANRTLGINNFVGDSGAGGQAGAVPAPVAGDGAALKVLGANGSWLFKVDPSRQVLTTAPLTGGGNLGGDITLNISDFVGDSGAGGVRGTVPAPGAGDAAAGKYLGASGAWSVPPGGLQNFVNARTAGTIQGAITAACAASPIQGVYIDPQYSMNETFTNTCNAVVLDARGLFNSHGTLNVRNFGADGTGYGYVNMVTNSASLNVTCGNNMPTSMVGKYLHVLRAGPGGGIFKSLITNVVGSTCTVADLPTASVTAGGWAAGNDDDAPAFNAAMAVAAVTGAKVVVPPGNYFLQSPIKLPAQQTATVPFTLNSIQIEGLGGNTAAQLYYVQNATTGPMRAIIEGPTIRTATTSWSQTGTTVTVNMASNPYNVNDLVDFWTPTGGHLNSGDYSTGNIWANGVTGGYVVTARTATSITFNSDLSQTAGATEVGEVSEMGTPTTPWIHGLTFQTLDYPYGTKTGTFLANGIDTKAYLGFQIDGNYFGNVSDGIRLYRSWLGTLQKNVFQGPNIGIHFPRNLGAVNAVRVIDNNFEACYNLYGILAEANQDGGSYENSYIRNEFEGTCVNTRADAVVNGGGLIWDSGYYETAGSHEALYTNLINNGYGNFRFHFPLGLRAQGGNSTYSMEYTGGSAQWFPPSPAPTITRVAGAGTFPAGRDVYIHQSFRKSASGWESNPSASTTQLISNTVLNDRVQVNQSLYQDWSQSIDQFCVYEADIATGGAAPANSAYKKVSCGPLGTAINVDTTATGTQQRSIGWSIEQGTTGDQYTGIVPSMISGSIWDPVTDNYTAGNNVVSGPLGYYNGPLNSYKSVIGGTNEWTRGSGRVDVGGAPFGSSYGQPSTSASYPIEFGSSSKIPQGTLIHNAQMFYVPNNPIDSNWGWLCVANPCTANPVTQSQWRRFGETFQRATIDGTTTPSTGAGQTWYQGDYVKNTAPIPQTEFTPTIKGWLNTVTGTTGATWKPDYLFDPLNPTDIGTGTPAVGSFTQGNFKSIGTDPATLCSQIGCTVNFWMKADSMSGTYTDGASVPTITDSAPGAHNMTCGSGGTQPVYKTNIFNGQPVIRFTQGTTGECDTASYSITGSYTILVVASHGINPGQYERTLFGNAFNYLFYPYGGAGSGTTVKFYNNQGSAGYPSFTTTTAPDDGLQHVVSGTFQIGTSGASGLWIDGTNYGTSSTATSVLDFTSNGVHLSSTVASSFSYGGDVGEVIVITPALPAFNKQQIEAYLGAKWGVNATLQNVVNIKNGANAIIGGFDQAGKLISQGSQRNFTTVTYSATPQFDASATDAQKITLTGNVTSSTLLHITLGQHFTFEICQDATGGRTFVWPTNVIGAATIGSVPNQCYMQTFVYDGTNAVAATTMVSNAGKSRSNGSSTGFLDIAFSATPTYDFTATNTIHMTLTANVTSSTATGLTQGQMFNVILCQDGTGSWTNVWPANFLGTMTIGSTASKCNAQSFVFDGTNAIALSPGVTNQ